LIYASMLALYRDSEPIDVLAVAEHTDGIQRLDEMLNGLHRGRLYVIAARPAMVKPRSCITSLPTPRCDWIARCCSRRWRWGV
jgi:replicative DNA helicase